MANAIAADPANNQLADALDHLANAGITDKGTMNTITEHIKALTNQNNALIEQNGMLITMIAHLTNPKQQTTSNTPKKKGKPSWYPAGYCWSHGFRVNHMHNSQTCSNKSLGHQVLATRSNTMGGSQSNKD